MMQARTSLPRFESRNAYQVWAERQSGRGWERHGNQVVVIAPDQTRHERIKACVRQALDAAIRTVGSSCKVLGGGTMVGVEEDTDYEPDAIVAFGDRGAFEPVIIVEVSSPSISSRDLNIRLADYFLLPSVRHCLVVGSEGRQVLHHRLGNQGELVTTTTYQGGSIRLEPEGIALAVSDLYPDDFQ
ncbi:Uma2 family endonuclease [Lichenicoccus sp.]|uniref:Uma2 family endonuclease n=1 Tax=Lichenicoccus sp. TaxID=2781899 RepID=UPI003D14E3B5